MIYIYLQVCGAEKDPSPDINPAIHKGLGTFISVIKGLLTGTIWGKAFLTAIGKPKFIEAHILIISSNPTEVKCSLLFSLLIINLNNSKSALFCVIKWYLLKCDIIVSISLKDLTLYTHSLLEMFIEPILLKYDLISSNKGKSLISSLIWKVSLTLQLSLFFSKWIIKEPSASVNPDINQGSIDL